jgi:HSP20 family protein
MAVIPKVPHDWLILFRQQINEMFSFLSSFEKSGSLGDSENLPFLDIFETEHSFVVEVELPGCERSDISLIICCTTLVIEGYKREDAREQPITYICLERRFGRFCRTVEIPPGVNYAAISAKFEKGLLTVTMPRADDKKVLIRNIVIE